MQIVEQDIEEHPPLNRSLAALKHLGPGGAAVQQIFSMIGHSRFFSDFTRTDIETLARSMQIYFAEPDQALIREGDIDDYMLLLIEGEVEIVKRDRRDMQQPMTRVGPGATLGEMSMIDGEPRFATCTAVTPATFAVLSRDGMVKLILEEPSLGAKILIKLVTLLSARLRQTSHTLLHHMER